MKRPLLFFLLVMMLAWVVTTRYFRVHNAPRRNLPGAQQLWAAKRAPQHALRAAQEARTKAQQAAQEARVEVHRALAEARNEFHQSLAEAHEELHCALDEVRESVEGIPVSIVPGTRVVEALPQPPALPECPSPMSLFGPYSPPGPPPDANSPGFPGPDWESTGRSISLYAAPTAAIGRRQLKRDASPDRPDIGY